MLPRWDQCASDLLDWPSRRSRLDLRRLSQYRHRQGPRRQGGIGRAGIVVACAVIVDLRQQLRTAGIPVVDHQRAAALARLIALAA